MLLLLWRYFRRRRKGDIATLSKTVRKYANFTVDDNVCSSLCNMETYREEQEGEIFLEAVKWRGESSGILSAEAETRGGVIIGVQHTC